MRRNRFIFAAVLILVLAAALRFHQIETQSFWNDEGNSARLSERSIELIIEGTASDIHPPLYYLSLRGWREFLGESELALRAFSAFSGICLVATTIALGRRLISSKAYGPTLVSALLVAINPALIYYSQEARMYELLALLAVLSTLLLVKWFQGDGKKNGLAVAYILSAAAGLYTHYFFPAILVAQNLIFVFWLVNEQRSTDDRLRQGLKPATLMKSIIRWIGMMLVVFLLYLPWLPTYWNQAGDRQALRLPIYEFVVDGLRWSAIGFTIEEPVTLWLLLVFLAMTTLGLWFGRHRINKGVPFVSTLLLSAFVPLFLMWLLGATQPAFFKFILVIIPSITLLAGPGWWWGWRWTFTRQGNDGKSDALPGDGPEQGEGSRLLARLLLVTAAIALIVGSTAALTNMYYDSTYARADYRGIVAEIANENHPNAGIVLNAANQWEVFTYYHQEGAPVYPLPRGYPDPLQIDEELAQISARHNRIYAVFWGEAERDPQRIVERWLDANAFKARDEWRGDIRFVTYSLTDDPEDLETLAFEGLSSIEFGDAIRLEKAEISSGEFHAGDIVQIALHWKTEESIEKRYKVFIHLVDSQGQIVTQRDSEPGGGLALTTTWTPGETIVDNHGLQLPSDLAPGSYTVLLGLYDLADPLIRLPIFLPDGEEDAFLLASIIVK